MLQQLVLEKKKTDQKSCKKGDLVVLLGGSTGRDGIGGSQFASDSLESEDRSAVQIPDPFIEKLIIEAILEARNEKLIHAMKDLVEEDYLVQYLKLQIH